MPEQNTADAFAAWKAAKAAGTSSTGQANVPKTDTPSSPAGDAFSAWKAAKTTPPPSPSQAPLTTKQTIKQQWNPQNKSVLGATADFAGESIKGGIEALNPYPAVKAAIAPFASGEGFGAQKSSQQTSDINAQLSDHITLMVKSGKLTSAEGAKLLGGLPQAATQGNESVAGAFVKGATAGAGVMGTAELGMDAVSGGKAAIKSLVPKTDAEIFATPESEVSKLNATDQKTWFENQRRQITSKGGAAEAKRVSDLKVKSELGTKKAQALVEELNNKAPQAVLKARPKIIQSMQEQSKIYRQYVENAMAGREKVPVDKQGLKDFIDSQYVEDPGRAAAIKEKLGLTEQVNPMTTKGPGLEIKQPTTTLGKMYAQAKSLRGTVSKSPTKVFSTDDKLTDDAISILLEHMKNNGVDLKEANQFWASYAPTRNKMVSIFKPFDYANPANLSQGTTLLQNAARGTGKEAADNRLFMFELEKMTGPLTEDLKSTVAKMSANDRKMAADEIASALQKDEIKASTEKSLQNLSARERQVERQARKSKIIRGILKGLGVAITGFEADKAIKKYTGLGF